MSLSLTQNRVGFDFDAEADRRLIVIFKRGAQHNAIKSQNEGTPIFEGVDMVRIQQPGERDYVERPVTEVDKMRFAEKWRAYQDGRQLEEDGTPLAVLFPKEPEIVEMLRGLGFATVQQLSGATEAAISRLGMGGRMLQQKAQAFMEDAGKFREGHRLAKELDDEKAKNALLEQRIAALEKLATDQPKRGPGRPRRDEEYTE